MKPDPVRGFSLLELMIVVAVVALLMLAGLPALSGWLANVRVRNAADALQNALRLSQAEALRANGTVILRLTADATPSTSSTASATGLNWILLDASLNKIQAKGNEGQKGVTMAPKNADGTSNSTFAGNIQYDGLGRPTNLAAALQFHFSAPNSDHPMRVFLTPAGRVRMCDPARTTGDTQACE